MCSLHIPPLGFSPPTKRVLCTRIAVIPYTQLYGNTNWAVCFSFTFPRAINSNAPWLCRKHSKVKAVSASRRVPLCFESGFPGWLFKTAHVTFSFLGCPHQHHRTLKNLKVRNTSWVLVSFSSESKPNVNASHCGIHGVRRNSTQSSFPVRPCPFLSHLERSFVELKFLLHSIKCMTLASCCCIYCSGWTWCQDSREPGVGSQNPHCSPSSFRKLKMLYSPGSSAGEFILTSGH